EVAIRLALGASRGRLVRQLLVESALLSLAGGLLGLLIAPPTMHLLVGVMPQMDPPLKFLADPNLRALGFTVAVSVFTALVFGLAPALRATRPNLAPTLKDQPGAVAGGGQAAWRKLLVSAQVALVPSAIDRRGLVYPQPVEPPGSAPRIRGAQPALILRRPHAQRLPDRARHVLLSAVDAGHGRPARRPSRLP